MPSKEDLQKFKRTIWQYYRRHGRDLPWRHTTDPYRIVVSEIMLQQTQVDRVIPKYREWVRQFPSWRALVRASLTDVLAAWQGLGYNRRGLALKKIADIITTKYHGKLPQDVAELDALPHIGPHTAGSIAAFAFNVPTVFIETNIRRVYIHFFFPRTQNVSDDRIAQLVTATVDRTRAREWYYALMDYGAMLGRAPKGSVRENPNRRSAHYRRQSKFVGSKRQVRGEVLRQLLAGVTHIDELKKKYSDPRVGEVLGELAQEGFVEIRGKVIEFKKEI